jgi:peptidoglycan/xylan/chitin deacetylase (PgdA/CDA1 family)
VTVESRPVRRRLLLTIGALALLGGCAEPEKGSLKAAPHTAPPGLTPSAAPTPWQVPTPAPAESGVCHTVPGVVERTGGPQHYLPCSGTNIALTIDDGPHPVWTPQILALLARHQIPATFCMIGRHVAAYPNLVAAIIDAGHHIANHTFTHPMPFTKLTPAQVRAEIDRTTDVITKASGGHRPTLFRAPGGAWSPANLEACAAAGMRPLDWSVDPRDWSLPGVRHIVETILNKTRPGAIILDHDGGGNRQQTIDALTIVLPKLIDAGFHFSQP